MMEFCSNGSLATYIEKNRGKISWQTKLEILIQVAKGMRFLHSKNVIHRDLKCDNVLLDQHMTAKITDFGASKLKQCSEQQMTKMVGTSIYIVCFALLYLTIRLRMF